MSLNVPAVNVIKVLDPRLQLQRQRDYVALKGALVNSWQQFPATNINNSSVQISCNPPSRDIAISRLVYQKFTYDIEINGTNTGADPQLLTKGFYGPRAMPITATTQSEQVTVNNATINQSPVSQYWPHLMRYQNEKKEQDGQGSLSPSMLDEFQDYAQGFGTNRNPLADYGDNTAQTPRGAFSGLEVLSNTATQAILRLTCTEPIVISPFVHGKKSNFTSAFSGVQNMSYTKTMGQLDRVLSLTPTQGDPLKLITSIIVNVSSASLLFNYFTPDPLHPIPRNIESAYFSLVSYPTRSSALIAPGAEVSLTMNSVQVSSIPRRIYIFARRDDNIKTAFTTDTSFGLPLQGNPMTLTWNNNQFLSQATPEDLYNVSVKNGFQGSYTQFMDKTGSVICLDFSTDIGLMSDESGGVLGNYQMGLTCKFKNTHPSESIAPTLYVVVVYEGVFNIMDGNCSQMIGVLSRSDVLNAQESPNVSYQNAEDIYGGSFFSKLGNAFSKAYKFVKDNRLISKGLSMISDPRAKVASNVAQKLGFGPGGAMLSRRRLRGGNINECNEDNEYLERLKYDSTDDEKSD